ncbi:MAG: ABC transporter permease [Acidimicrobiia bacterium]|nr:ABC transporter permease [Acidimicrobiia bacterium]
MFLSIREIRRSPGRFALLTGAVALLVVLLLFFQAVAGTLTLGLTGGIENNGADVFVYSDRARRNPAASLLPGATPALVVSVDGVADASPVGRSIFEAGGEDIVVIGLVDGATTGPRELSAGRRAERSGEAVFSGSSLAASLDLGQRVTIEGVGLEVVGVADDAAFEVSPTLYVAFDDYETAVRARAGVPVETPASWIAVTVDDGADPRAVAERISAEVPGVEALDRSSAAAALPGVDQITSSFSILYLLLFIVVTIVTGVFFLILTVQKERSLVLLHAIGASRSDVVRPVLLQVLAVTGLGAGLGVGLAAGLLAATPETFGSSLDPITTILTVGFIVVLGVVASLGAVRRVLSVDPIDATTAAGAV